MSDFLEDEINPSGGPSSDDEVINPEDLDFGDWIEVMQYPEQFPDDLLGQVPDWVLDKLDKFQVATDSSEEDDNVEQ